jgi:hypothetical protein
MTLEQQISTLSNNELKLAFEEILEWRKNGILVDGIIRSEYRKWINYMNFKEYDFPIYAMEFAFEFEIAKRWYKEEN